jgi:hypothetical protein
MPVAAPAPVRLRPPYRQIRRGFLQGRHSLPRRAIPPAGFAANAPIRRWPWGGSGWGRPGRFSGLFPPPARSASELAAVLLLILDQLVARASRLCRRQ